MNEGPIPGLFLLTAVGLLPLGLAYGMVKRPRWDAVNRITSWSRCEWPWTGVIVFTIVLAAWLLVEVVLIGFYPVTIVTAAQGGVIILVALLPAVCRRFEKD